VSGPAMAYGIQFLGHPLSSSSRPAEAWHRDDPPHWRAGNPWTPAVRWRCSGETIPEREAALHGA